MSTIQPDINVLTERQVEDNIAKYHRISRDQVLFVIQGITIFTCGILFSQVIKDFVSHVIPDKKSNIYKYIFSLLLVTIILVLITANIVAINRISQNKESIITTPGVRYVREVII